MDNTNILWIVFVITTGSVSPYIQYGLTRMILYASHEINISTSHMSSGHDIIYI